jgi:hypothetical protein
MLAAVLAVTVWVGVAAAQEQPGGREGREGRGERGDRAQRTPEEMRQRIEEFRVQASQRMRENLGATEEEWKVLGPRVEKVTTLQRQSRGGVGGMLMGMMGGRGGRGGPGGDRGGPPGGAPPAGGDANAPQQSEVEQKTAALRTLLADENAKPEQIKAALTAVRDARAKSRAELETAQKELREVVTQRQEAQLVLMGMLE